MVYKNARLSVLKRDDYTCRFCGFRHQKNETHHVDDDHNNHSESNLVTACVLCHMSHHIAFAGIQGRGTMIYLQDAGIDQGALNQLVRTLWIAEEIAKGDLRSTASQILARLDKAEMLAVQVISTSSPSVLGDFMSSMSNDDYAKRDKALKDIYLLPKKSAYGQYIKQWAQESKNFSPEDWVKKAESKFAQWSESL
ncbi:HNH endonuclease [Pseudomonas putida]|uniref:HNH endonuclease n=1 Tax=Pseudomonas putida TaxID=303 RepID=A0A8I1JIX5_PSEPU|nr:HNH endonuclease [Pseudomonas putida]